MIALEEIIEFISFKLNVNNIDLLSERINELKED